MSEINKRTIVEESEVVRLIKDERGLYAIEEKEEEDPIPRWRVRGSLYGIYQEEKNAREDYNQIKEDNDD